MSRITGLVAIVALAAFLGCSRRGGESILSLKEITHPDIRRLDSAAKRAIEEAQQRLKSGHEKGVGLKELASLYGHLGQLYLAHEFAHAAEGCFANAQQLSTQDARWAYYCGHVHKDLGEPKSAIAEFERADELLQQQEAKTPHIAALYWLGEVCLIDNQIDEAEKCFQRILEMSPDSAAACVGLGKVASSRGEFEVAVEHFATAAELIPQATDIQYRLAIAYRNLGRMDLARVHMARIDPNKRADTKAMVPDPWMDQVKEMLMSAVGHRLRGQTLFDAGQYQSAARAFRRAIESDPEDPEAHSSYAMSLGWLGQYEKAHEHLVIALDLDPDHAKANYNLGVLMALRGDDARAIQYYLKAIAKDGTHKNARVNLANALVRNRDYERAEKHYRIVLDMDPTHRIARLGRIRTLTFLERYSDALRAVEDARESSPNDVALLDMHARLLVASPDSSVRDGAVGLSLAKRAFDHTKEVEHGETLAMALAENKRYYEAAQLQAQLIDFVVSSADKPDLAGRLRSRLQLYEQQLPCRVPWTKDVLFAERPRPRLKLRVGEKSR